MGGCSRGPCDRGHVFSVRRSCPQLADLEAVIRTRFGVSRHSATSRLEPTAIQAVSVLTVSSVPDPARPVRTPPIPRPWNRNSKLLSLQREPRLSGSNRETGIPFAVGTLQFPQEAPMEASRTAPVHANSHAESRKAYRDPTVPRRLYLPASVRLRGAREVLRLAASRHLDLEKIARLSGVSRGHLLRLFRQAGLSSPMRQLRRMELDQVVERLQTTDLSLATLAKEFGYADGSSLRRAIRRAFGHPPSTFRKNRRNA